MLEIYMRRPEALAEQRLRDLRSEGPGATRTVVFPLVREVGPPATYLSLLGFFLLFLMTSSLSTLVVLAGTHENFLRVSARQ